MTRTYRMLLIIAVGAALAGCSRGMSDLRNFVGAEQAKKPGPIEPLPQVRPYESFSYEAGNLRSPFAPDVAIISAPSGGAIADNGIAPDPNRNREYLESFPLDSLDMVGTLAMTGESYGLVQDPEGAVHPVQAGNYLGQNYGKITKITASEITLTEIVPDGLGGWIERPAAVALGGQ